ncbi:hypothetical protein DFH08DRAFT_710246, partial [Mycena albidolilacea]
IVEVIKAAFAEATALQFHLTPFRRFRTSAADGEERVYDEVHASEAWVAEHEKLQRSPGEGMCKLRVIAGLMWWSDSTRLANFGTVKAWPLYTYFTNLWKYVRARPTSGA